MSTTSVIYQPTGEAREYAEYALNIYTGCPHGCTYCYAPRVLHMPRTDFQKDVFPRRNILERTRATMETGKYVGKLIHLCFSCDPYPAGHDVSITRKIIMTIKGFGGHVQILTKDPQLAIRDFDLLDDKDWYGVTLTSMSDNFSKKIEPRGGSQAARIYSLYYAGIKKINTWVSFEPVIRQSESLDLIALVAEKHIATKFYIGKINYALPEEPMSWKEFASRVKRICEKYGQDYKIKTGLMKMAADK